MRGEDALGRQSVPEARHYPHFCSVLSARSERVHSPLPRTALRLVRGYENIVPLARFSVASNQALSVLLLPVSQLSITKKINIH